MNLLRERCGTHTSLDSSFILPHRVWSARRPCCSLALQTLMCVRAHTYINICAHHRTVSGTWSLPSRLVSTQRLEGCLMDSCSCDATARRR
jgi:hypothetical protein